MSKKYIYNFNNIHEGQVFKNFTELVKAVTGEKLSTGAKNRQAVKNVLYKHIDYCTASEYNADITSSRALIVTKIYDTPRIPEEHRGKHGVYADYLRPLLLTSCGHSFRGKICTLVNRLGVFKEYTFPLFFNTHLQEQGNATKFHWTEFNPWTTHENTSMGVQKYKSTLWYQIRNTVTGNLDSLQKDGILEWNYYYQFIPSILIDIDGTHQKRPKSLNELQVDKQKRDSFLEEVAHDTNSVLLPETLHQLNIYSDAWSHEVNYDAYRDRIYASDPNNPSEFPLRTTAEQEAAIENLNAFMRQYAYMKFYNLQALPSIEEEDVSSSYKFFNNPSLSMAYKKLVAETLPWLIECKVMWRELEYHVFKNSEPVNRYTNSQTFDKKQYQDVLSQTFIQYMDSHMDKIQFVPNDSSDLNGTHIGRLPNTMPLNRSNSACAFHDRLKGLYNI